MTGLLAQRLEIQAQSLIFAGAEAAQPLTGEHHGPMPIAALEVELGNGNLEDALQHRPYRALGFMPKLFEAVVTGVPVAGIEQCDGQLQTWIR